MSYLVTGGVASIVYGEPRFTRDIDLVLQLHPDDADRFVGAWPAEQFYVPPIETIREEIARPLHGHCNLVHHETGLRADVYLAGTDELNAWAMGRPHIERVEADEIRLAPIEYVIVQKLIYFRDGGSDRHLTDIARMLRIRGDLVDQVVLDRWIARYGLAREWERAKKAPE